MVRFLSHIFGWHYEPCKGCEVLRQQLEYANQEKKDAVNTLLDILRPKPVIEEKGATLLPINAVPAGNWARRRAVLEQQDRERAKVEAKSRFIARPDNASVDRDPTADAAKQESIEALEREVEALEANRAR